MILKEFRWFMDERVLALRDFEWVIYSYILNLTCTYNIRNDSHGNHI